MSGARRRLADRLAAERIPDEPEQLHGFAEAIGRRLEERGIVGRMPGLRTAAEEAQEAHRLRVRQVLVALKPQQPPAPPEAEPEQPARLADQIKALLGQQTGEQPDAPALNSPELIRRAAGG